MKFTTNTNASALHNRLRSPYNYTSAAKSSKLLHIAVGGWSTERFIKWAESIHPDVKLFIEGIFENNNTRNNATNPA
ncbi:MAG: hypothetical protein IPP86_07055 [Bacteroidetes bacterium]|nr:hypothetical protein [Bacteroidota bacterium]